MEGADVDLVREMIQYVAQRMMELDTEGLRAAGYGERSPERANSRNGYRERLWETRAGSVDLKIPKLREGSYFPEFLEPRRTADLFEARTELFGSRRAPDLALLLQFPDPDDELIEETWWQEPVVHAAVCAFDGPQIKTWPREHIELIEDHPRAFTVEP